VADSRSVPLRVPDRSGAGILLVEDEASVRYIMRRTLEEAGYTVLEAESCADALTLLGKEGARINLVLTDVIMPGGGGRELAERVAAGRPDMPVLFTSGYTDGDIERRGLLPPGAAFLQKPVTPEALVRAVGMRLELGDS
jgi:CheY-like chemotaxis protein